MRMPILILTLMTATLPIAPASPQDQVNPARKNEREESAKKVKELQKERIATLKQMADLISNQFKTGNISFEEVLEAKLLVFKAELDAAEKESDRITLYKNIVDELKKCETLADDRFKQARGSFSAVLKFKARRLEAEINLERAKAKEAKKAK